MRTVTAHLFSSLDGVVSSPNLFQFDSFGPEEGAAMGAALAPVTDVVLGRVAWSEWADFWPSHTDDPFAQFINPVRKHVASRTLTDVSRWQGSTLLDGDLLDAVRALKAGEGGQITVVGISVIRQLFLAGLVDQLMLTVHPVVAGAGTHLFEPDQETTRLRLLEGRTTSVGNLMLSYALRD